MTIARQIAELSLAPRRPLVICDADEVVTRFVAGLRAFLEAQGVDLHLKTYDLAGNAVERATGRMLGAEEITAHLKAFFETGLGSLDVVPGAPEALSALSRNCQIVILSNVPRHLRHVRADWFARHGMSFPVIANAGLKDGAVVRLAASVTAPVFFIDDLPANIAAVAGAAPRVSRIHFMADSRLARLVGAAPGCHLHTTEWHMVTEFVEARLAQDLSGTGAG